MQTEKRVAIVAAALLWAVAAGSAAAQEQPVSSGPARTDETLSPQDLAAIRAVEAERRRVIEKVIGSVVCIYGHDRQGGGSGVIVDPSGIVLTNHHVIEGAGVSGLGGLNDGVLYEWDLVGTDPGGDVAIIKLRGKDQFPWSPLGDSDKVRIGDWTLAMGNPFLLAHDQVATVTLGIVSGVERFQGGMGNQLVYGNCIQVDTSINPGNSGGPLFNMSGEVIGINGRGSFRDRGRVNVGLGYAISSNQIRNFIPDLLATKVTRHGTLDASFSERDGKIVCSTLNLDSSAAAAGLELGDELLEFEEKPIRYVNQFKNLICTLPSNWPANLKVRKEDGREIEIAVRLFGLPYNFSPDNPEPDKNPDKEPPPGDEPPKDDDKDAGKEEDKEGESEGEEKEQAPSRAEKSREGLKQFLLSEPDVAVSESGNQETVKVLIDRWKRELLPGPQESLAPVWKIEDEIHDEKGVAGSQTIFLAMDGKFRVEQKRGDQQLVAGFDGENFWTIVNDARKNLTLIEAKTNPLVLQAVGMMGPAAPRLLERFGKTSLEGGDQVLGHVTSRLVILDERGDWLYCWCGLPSPAWELPEMATRGGLIRQISADRDLRRTGAIQFGDWHDFGGFLVARERRFVKELECELEWTVKTVKCAPSETDTTIFGPG
jgi:serine protease Do